MVKNSEARKHHRSPTTVHERHAGICLCAPYCVCICARVGVSVDVHVCVRVSNYREGPRCVLNSCVCGESRERERTLRMCHRLS